MGSESDKGTVYIYIYIYIYMHIPYQKVQPAFEVLKSCRPVSLFSPAVHISKLNHPHKELGQFLNWVGTNTFNGGQDLFDS